MGENFKLNDGTICDNSMYCKYGARITILRGGELNDPLDWHSLTKEMPEMNLPHMSSCSYIRGDFFTSKKGTPCFKIKDDGRHVLIRDDWGGAFNSYRGGKLPECPERLFYRRASSNGGGAGYDYGIYPVGYKYAPSIDDI